MGIIGKNTHYATFIVDCRCINFSGNVEEISQTRERKISINQVRERFCSSWKEETFNNANSQTLTLGRKRNAEKG
jgi:hypothetical protein